MSPKSRKAVKRKAEASPESITGETPPTINDLSGDLLTRVLKLTGSAARYATVCKAWHELLAQSSEVWQDVVLCGKQSGGAGPETAADTGAITNWLLPRRACMEAVTFKRFATVRDNDGGAAWLAFFCTVAGLLADAPLRALRFEGCALPPKLLPSLVVLRGLTSLHLDRVAAGGPGHRMQQLSAMFQALPRLETVSLTLTYADSGHQPWPEGLSSCTRLRRCSITDLSGCMAHLPLPDSISNLAALQSLRFAGWVAPSMSTGISRLTALSVLRMLARPSPAVPVLHLPPEVAALAPSLQRLSFFSRSIPPKVSTLQSLKRLSIGGLRWSSEVGAEVAKLSVLTNVTSLRVHHCQGLYKTWSGLFTLMNGLPKLQSVALDGNAMTHTSCGHCSRQLTAIDLRGSAFGKEGLPQMLRRAESCRKLQLSVQSWDALTQGGTKPMSACPLLYMAHLETLIIQQPAWPHDDVTAVLALQQCFQEIDIVTRTPAWPRTSARRSPTITCPVAPPKHAPWGVDGPTAESSDDEDEG